MNLLNGVQLVQNNKHKIIMCGSYFESLVLVTN